MSRGDVITSASAAETRAVGRTLAAGLMGGDVVLLSGDLGAGKTELTKGIAAGLCVPELIQSPTFALVDEHPAPALGPTARLIHVDLYRLDPEELDGIGWDDLVGSEGDVVVVEWPERAVGRLPDRYLLVELTATGPDGREIRVERVLGRIGP